MGFAKSVGAVMKRRQLGGARRKKVGHLSSILSKGGATRVGSNDLSGGELFFVGRGFRASLRKPEGGWDTNRGWMKRKA